MTTTDTTTISKPVAVQITTGEDRSTITPIIRVACDHDTPYTVAVVRKIVEMDALDHWAPGCRVVAIAGEGANVVARLINNTWWYNGAMWSLEDARQYADVRITLRSTDEAVTIYCASESAQAQRPAPTGVRNYATWGATALLFLAHELDFERDWYNASGNVRTMGSLSIPLSYNHKYERWELMCGRVLDEPSHGYELIISDALSEEEQEALLQTGLAEGSERLHDSPVVPDREITEPRIAYADLDKIYYERDHIQHGITVADRLEDWYAIDDYHVAGPIPAYIYG
jgi:hypothetical protein